MNHLYGAGKLKLYCLFDYESPAEDNFPEKNSWEFDSPRPHHLLHLFPREG